MLGLKVRRPPNLVDRRRPHRAMDAQGIDMEALSINPFWYGADRDSPKSSSSCRTRSSPRLCAAHPDRFVAFATVAMQHPGPGGRSSSNTASRSSGCAACRSAAASRARNSSDPKFHPIWAKAEELGVLVFIHPIGTASSSQRLKGNGGLDNTIGNPLETTLALSHLIFEGTLDRYPRPEDLRRARRRLSAVLRAALGRHLHHLPGPLRRRAAEEEADRVSEAALLRHARLHARGAAPPGRARSASSQIMMGTDYPFPWTRTPVDHILNTPGSATPTARDARRHRGAAVGNQIELGACINSLRLDAGCLHDRPPFLELGLVERCERCRGPSVGRRQVHAEIGDALANHRIGHRGVGSGVDLSDDIGRRVFGSPEAVPGAEIETGETGLVHGRHLRCRRPTGLGHDRECLDVAGAVLRQRIGGKIAIQIDLPRHQIVKRRCAAAIRNVLERHPSGTMKRHAANRAMLAVPVDEAVPLSGLAFSQSTNSLRLFAGNVFRAVIQ